MVGWWMASAKIVPSVRHVETKTPLHQWFRRQQAFTREAIAEPRSVGAIAASSGTLARALAAPAAWSARPLRVLEVGAGTGSATRALFDVLPPHSTLDIVECNPHFGGHLRALLAEHPRICGRVHVTTIQQFCPEERYDCVVSALPLTNFAPDDVGAILTGYLDMLVAGGWLSYFSYLGTYPLRRLTSSSAAADRHRAVQAVMRAFEARHGVRRERVWANLPPAAVTYARPAGKTALLTESFPPPGSAAGPGR